MLIGATENNNGQLFDPIDRIGHWHNNSSFADVHTQSPRTTSFGGGANGGMDDRFDWLLVSAQLLDESSVLKYIENSYVPYGNDGNHFNDAINNGNNFSNFHVVALGNFLRRKIIFRHKKSFIYVIYNVRSSPV